MSEWMNVWMSLGVKERTWTGTLVGMERRDVKGQKAREGVIDS